MKKAPYTIPESRKVRVIIDTDCHCEADDQFAVAHQLMTPKIDVVGIVATHYATQFGAGSVNESMQESYDEAQRVVNLMGLTDQVKIYKGCTEQMTDEKVPLESDASRFIVQEAMKDDPRPLFVTVQGAASNIASALLMKPEIAQRMTVIWIGGGVYPEGGMEFNTINDAVAANTLMESQVELWQIPKTVYRSMKVSIATLYDRVYPYGKIGKYLVDYLVKFNNTFVVFADKKGLPNGISAAAFRADYPGGESWSLGDSPVVGLILDSHEGQYTFEGAPRFDLKTCNYTLRPENPRKIRVYSSVDTHFILEDFFAKIKYYFGD